MRSVVVVLILVLGGGCGLFGNTPRVPEAVTCTGGARPVRNVCTCPLGTSWSQDRCAGDAQPGACAQGNYAFGDACLCLYGFTRDAAGACVALRCAPGALAGADQCYCPAGTKWDGAACAAFTCGGGSLVAGDHCECPAGAQWSNVSSQCLVCMPGAVLGQDDLCHCPDGSQVAQSGQRCLSCGGGAYLGQDDLCHCPEGSQLGVSGQCLICPPGSQLVGDACFGQAVAQQPPAAPPPYVAPVVAPAPEPRTERRVGQESSVTVTRTQVSSAQHVARDHEACDRFIPAVPNADVQMATLLTTSKREPCHRCVNGGRAFRIYGLQPLNYSCD